MTDFYYTVNTKKCNKMSFGVVDIEKIYKIMIMKLSSTSTNNNYC